MNAKSPDRGTILVWWVRGGGCHPTPFIIHKLSLYKKGDPTFYYNRKKNKNEEIRDREEN